MTHRDPLLLVPGPVTLSERVHHALCAGDLGPGEDDCAELTLDVRRRLEALHPGLQGHEAVLLTGPGSAAVEAMLDSLVPRDGKVLVVSNGGRGERMAAALHAHGRALVPLRGAWDAGLELRAVERALDDDRRITHVAAVHHETTTGRLNDLEGLGRVCRELERPLLLDAVASFGGEALDVERWNVAALACSADRCLHGAPGVGFVLARRALLDAAGQAGTLVLDLARHRHEQRRGRWPFSPATHVLRALQEALCELEEQGGWEARRERYRALSGRVRAGLPELGLEVLLEGPAASSAVSAFALPREVAFARLHDRLREEGFVLGAGPHELAAASFQVAAMGDLRDSDVERLLGAFGHVLGR